MSRKRTTLVIVSLLVMLAACAQPTPEVVEKVVKETVVVEKEVPVAGEVFNIGGDQEISILQLARRVKTILDSPSEITCVPYEEAFERGFEDMMRRVPDIGKIRSWLDYRPRFGIDRIIQDVASYERGRVE